jgi:hypothetical protein
VAKQKTGKDTRLAARYIDSDLVFSDTHVWTYLRVPVVPYEFVDYRGRQAIADRLHLALGALVTGSEPVDVHLIVTSRPINIDFWAEDLDERVTGWAPAPGWPKYLNAMQEHLKGEEYLRKEVYLGVCLGPRKGKGSPRPESMDLLGPIKKLLGKAESALQFEDDVIPDKDLEHFRKKAREVQRSLGQSSMQATPAHPNSVAWLITKPLHPAMFCPPPTVSPNRVWGPGEIQALGEGLVTNGHRRLEIEQIDQATGNPVVGYTATLALSRFPDVLLFPDQEPWMHYASSLAFPIDVSSRMTLVPALKVQKDVGRKLAEAKDQATHIAETGGMVPLDVQEQQARATALEYTISKDRLPWSYGRHRMTVSAPTEDLLNARIRKIIEHYRDLSIDVVLPSGDQMDLLNEAQPGDRVRSKAYYQRQELMLVAGGMPTASAEVGDRIEKKRGWIGPYIGETTSRVRTMVNFSPHVAMTRNYPPGVAIIGAPGGGKSFLAFTLAYQMAMSGVWTIYIDPKADAKPMADLPGLGSPKMFDLRFGHDGLLDPFGMTDSIPEATVLAMETILLLLGGHISEEREEALTTAIQKVASEPNPSLLKIVQALQSDQENAHARNLGNVLKTMSELPFARLCFAPNTGTTVRPEEGLTVITLLGLDLPTSSDSSTYGYENRLAVSVMYLLTRYARRLMMSLDKSHPKAICIDEAWAITSTPQGAKLIPEVARMGRSHNTALVLVSQNAADLSSQSVTNSLSAKFAFRSTIPGEIDDVLTLLGMDKTEEHRATIRELNNGECIFQDIDGRLGRVQVDSWDQALFDAFNTNPETRGKGVDTSKATASAAADTREWSA